MSDLILFRYTRLCGAEYFSHLDVIRHLGRIFRRAGLTLENSDGFHPHPKLFLGPPSGTGVASEAEYGEARLVEAPRADEFRERFNAASPAGIRCLAAYGTDRRINLAAEIAAAEYSIRGVDFPPSAVLDEEKFFVGGRNGEIDVRDRIYALERAADGGMRAVLAFGNRTLRPVDFGKALAARFGGEPEFLRTAALTSALRPVESLIGAGGET